MTNTFLACAAAGLALLGIAHSVLGETLVFRPLRTPAERNERAERSQGAAARPGLPASQLRILRGTWHVASVLCWALSALLWRLGTAPWDAALGAWAADVVGFATLASGVLVFGATHGRHPAWCALLVIASLVWWR